jgi:16S rRNA (guanine527-N7)-methyltransferase
MPIRSWEEYCERESVSRETLLALQVYHRLLRDWSSTLNLVAPKTLDDVWIRHFADSLQLRKFIADATTVVDLGSGAGFPGLVLAVAAIGAGVTFHLVESDQRKCAFLRAVVLETGANVKIYPARIEHVISELPTAGAVTARALKSLDELVKLSAPLIDAGALGVFPKGRDYADELTLAQARSNYSFACSESLTSQDSRIVIVRSFNVRVSSTGKVE